MPGVVAPLLKVKTKYQITLPTALREEVGLSVGDLLEAKVEGKKITLTPKNAVDRELALALEDIAEGRIYGPYHSVPEMLRGLHKNAKKLAKKSRKSV